MPDFFNLRIIPGTSGNLSVIEVNWIKVISKSRSSLSLIHEGYTMSGIKKLHYVSIIVVIFLCTGCWKHQDNAITRPDIPHYSFSGNVVDWDSDSTMSGISVVLSEVKLVYDVVFDTVTVVTDSAGNFIISPVYPGKYFLHFVRDNYPVGDLNIQIDYSDVNRNYRLPKIFFASRLRSLDMVYTGKPMAINNTTCWFFSTDIMQFKWEQDYWVLDRTMPNLLKEKNIKACTIVDNNFYVAHAPDSLVVLNRFDGSLEARYPVSANLTGLAYDKTGNRLFSCSRTAIYLHDSTKAGFAETWSPPVEQLEALAWKDGLYSYDNTQQVLKLYDDNWQVVATYAIIDTRTGRQIEKITDMDFDAYGDLWISGY